MKQLPNAVTLLNLFLGSVAIVLAIKGHAQYTAIIIGICALLDFADGMLARVLKAHSPLGQQLDSLADLVSFGLAPSAIVYFYIHEAAQPLNHAALQIVLPFSGFILAVFAGLRLAIFNIDSRQSDSFIGLPTPANAAFFASLPFVKAFAPQSGLVYELVNALVQSIPAQLILIVVFSFLMISPINMFSLKIKSLSWSGNEIRYIFMALVIISFLIFGIQAVALIVVFYIILSLAQSAFSSLNTEPFQTFKK